MNLEASRPDSTPDFAEPIPDRDLDWTWPAADALTDDSIARSTLQTCSELGSQRIRLINIRPGSSDDTIECDTKVCFLSDTGEYTAISYTWGCPVERRQINMDNQPRLVTVNLWRFLWQARRLPKQFTGWLWIDALSIQQSDPWEKLEQVKLLSTIFAGATGAVVWLGPAYGNSDRAMKCLGTQKTKSSRWRAPRSVWASPTSSAMLELCERPYWIRLWVYQELKASQTTAILCGSQWVLLDSLESLMHDNHDERVKAKMQALRKSSAGEMLRLTHASMDRSLRAMLDSTSHLRCTDPRDKVYAILNVVSSGHQDIEANYTRTLPNLVNRILRNMHASKKPQSLMDVSWQCSLLGTVFDMSESLIYTTEAEAPTECLYPVLVLSFVNLWRGRTLCAETMENYRRSTLPFDKIDLVLQDVGSWCKHHNHQEIARLVRQELPGRLHLVEPELELNDREMLLRSGSEEDLKTIRLCEEMGKILKSFESIC